jgi:pre-rRNA-processing protein IPI3
MLSEIFITSIRAEQRSANTAIAKDIGIYVHTLHPAYSIKSTFKKSSTQPNCTAVSTTHIFAAQVEKAVIHVYSRDRGNQEALISFPERIHCLTLVNDGLLALGTAEGRIILWEVGSSTILVACYQANALRYVPGDRFLRRRHICKLWPALLLVPSTS